MDTSTWTWADLVSAAKNPEYGWMRFRRGKSGRVRRIDSEEWRERLVFSEKPLTEPLLAKKPASTVDKALEISKKLLAITHDRKSRRSRVDNLLTLVEHIRHDETTLAEEAILQVMKQMNQNPSINSRIWLWKVFVCLINAVPLAKAFLPHVVSFLFDEGADNLDGE